MAYSWWSGAHLPFVRRSCVNENEFLPVRVARRYNVVSILMKFHVFPSADGDE